MKDTKKIMDRMEKGIRQVATEQVAGWSAEPLKREDVEHLIADPLTEGQAATLNAWLQHEVVPRLLNIVEAYLPDEDEGEIRIDHVNCGDTKYPVDFTKPIQLTVNLPNNHAMRHTLADLDFSKHISLIGKHTDPDLFTHAAKEARKVQQPAATTPAPAAEPAADEEPVVATTEEDIDELPVVFYLKEYDTDTYADASEVPDENWEAAKEGATLRELIFVEENVAVRTLDGRTYDSYHQGFVGDEAEEEAADEPETEEDTEPGESLDNGEGAGDIGPTSEDAREAGRQHAESGGSIEENPHDQDTELSLFSAWRGGFNEYTPPAPVAADAPAPKPPARRRGRGAQVDI